MRKQLLLLKALLVTVLMGVGTNAWGGTNTLFSQNFESVTAETLGSIWTSAGTGALVTGDATYGNYYSHTSGNSNSRKAYSLFYTAGKDFYSTYYNYSIDLDFSVTISTNNNNSQTGHEICIMSDGASNYSAGTTYTFSGANNKANYLFDLSSKTKNENTFILNESETEISLPNGWYHLKLEVSATASTTTTPTVKYTITNKSTSAVVSTDTYVLTNANYKAFGIYLYCARYWNYWFIDNVSITTEVDEEVVSKPSIAVAYSGANRTVTITPGESTESNEVTTYYTTNGEDPTSLSSVYSSAINITEDCTVKAISISSTAVASEIASQAITVGKLKLAAPTLTKTGYSAGKYTVSMTSDQSGLAYPPASYTHYYSIDSGDAVAYSAPFEINAGSSVTGYVAATDYTNSDESNLTSAVRPVLSEVWAIDFASQATEDKGAVTVGGEAFTANGTSFGNITSEGLTSNDNFGVKTGSAWLLRNNSRGLYSQNGSGTPVGVKSLTSGQYIRMVVSGMDTRSASGAGSLNNDMSTTTELYIVANEDGNVNINFNRYAFIKSIAVCNVTSVSRTISDAKYATYCSPYALDFSGVSGLKAYIAVKNNSGDIEFTQVSDVPANTGVLLKGDAGNYAIPVIAESTTDVDGNKFVGVTQETADVAAGIYVLLDGDSGVGFYKTTTLFTVGANTAYLPASVANAARKFIAFDDNGATAIKSVKSQQKGSDIYNLHGQRVKAAKRGLYIVNGKKVIK